eukprot:g26177.t1
MTQLKSPPSVRTIGVLALQGAFEEHEDMSTTRWTVRKIQELDSCDALVIPGGESTTMKIIAGTDEFMAYLRAYVHGGSGADGEKRKPRPVWGTCAGCILLSEDVVNSSRKFSAAQPVRIYPCFSPGEEQPAKRCKYGDPVGGLDVATCRNFFGRQAQSFEAAVIASAKGDGKDVEARREAFDHFPAAVQSSSDRFPQHPLPNGEPATCSGRRYKWTSGRVTQAASTSVGCTHRSS